MKKISLYLLIFTMLYNLSSSEVENIVNILMQNQTVEKMMAEKSKR